MCTYTIKLTIIFVFLITLFLDADEVYSKGDKNLLPANILGNAARSYNHISHKKIDNTGGLHLSSPLPGKMKYMKGPDVLNSCAFYGMTYTDKEMCENLKSLSLLSYDSEPQLDEMKDTIGLTSTNCANHYYLTYDRYGAFDTVWGVPVPRIEPIPDETKKTLDYCTFFCKSAHDTVDSRDFCGVEACLNQMGSNHKGQMGKYCYSMLKNWQKKGQNELLNRRIQFELAEWKGTSNAAKWSNFNDYEDDRNPSGKIKRSRFRGAPGSYCLENYQTKILSGRGGKTEFDKSCCKNDEYMIFIANYQGIQTPEEFTELKVNLGCE